MLRKQPGIEIEIKIIENNILTVFSSIRKTAISINSDIKTNLRKEKLDSEKGIRTPYKNKYIITTCFADKKKLKIL